MNTLANTLHNWMGSSSAIGTLRIDELVLPGTHNSGMDKSSPNTSLPQEITQDVPPREQLEKGIRVLDLRVSFYENYPPADARRFQIFHATSSGRTIEIDILSAVDEFCLSHESSGNASKEVVILDFHEFKNFTGQAHEQLQKIITDRIGKRIILNSLRHLTLNQLWAEHPGKNVVIAYNHGSAISAFWPGVNQRWSGSNLNTTATLKTFMDAVAKETKPDDELRSIQCAKYVLPFYAPDDFSDKVDEWFLSESSNSYIQKFHIINTDWSLRSNIVNNCIHASVIRGKSKS